MKENEKYNSIDILSLIVGYAAMMNKIYNSISYYYLIADSKKYNLADYFLERNNKNISKIYFFMTAFRAMIKIEHNFVFYD